jgi:hypothetical protein
MRLSRLALLGLAAAALLLTAQVSSAAQQNQGTLHTMIDALNAANQDEVQAHLADNFQLTFTGGTTVSGTEALDLLMLLDTPITIVSATPGGNQKGSAVLEFGGKGLMYTLDYTGARGGKFATWTINAPTSTTSGQ